MYQCDACGRGDFCIHVTNANSHLKFGLLFGETGCVQPESIAGLGETSPRVFVSTVLDALAAQRSLIKDGLSADLRTGKILLRPYSLQSSQPHGSVEFFTRTPYFHCASRLGGLQLMLP